MSGDWATVNPRKTGQKRGEQSNNIDTSKSQSTRPGGAPGSPKRNNYNNNNYSKNYKGGNNEKKSKNEDGQRKERAAQLLGCTPSALFLCTNTADPFNENNKLDVAICRADGQNYGSLVITRVNDENLAQPQVIHGTPKMEKLTPDQSCISSSLTVDGVQYYFANKWNGENICFFKYQDNSGNTYVSGRSRGTYLFVKDSNVSPTFSLVSQLLSSTQQNGNSKKVDLKSLPTELGKLALPEVQSITFELCGNKVPELVKYNFPTEFKPLFVTDLEGRITPFACHGTNISEIQNLASSSSVPPEDAPFSDRLAFWTKDGPAGPLTTGSPISSQLSGFVKKYLGTASALNKEFRASQNITSGGYYFENFALEGKVLYILKPDMTLLHHRVLFKLKPKEIEQSHTAFFDGYGQAKAIEALTKLYKKGENLEEESIRKEMDLNPREWAYFGKDVMSLVELIPNVFESHRNLSKQKMLILVGLPGSGKSTVANNIIQMSAAAAAAITENSSELTTSGEKSNPKKPPLSMSAWYRVNQDEMGSRHQCEQRANEAFLLGKSVVVDRCNFDIPQRNNWVKLARQHNVNDIRCLFLNIDPEVCKSRVTVREGHPTIPSGNVGHSIIDKFMDQLVPPVAGEGFTSIMTVRNDEELKNALDILIPLAQPKERVPLSTSSKKNSGDPNNPNSNPDEPPTVNPFALLAGNDEDE